MYTDGGDDLECCCREFGCYTQGGAGVGLNRVAITLLLQAMPDCAESDQLLAQPGYYEDWRIGICYKIFVKQPMIQCGSFQHVGAFDTERDELFNSDFVHNVISVHTKYYEVDWQRFVSHSRRSNGTSIHLR